MNHNQTYTGLAVFDVDGVIYRDIFLKRVAQATGFKNYLRALLLGWRYYTNTISFKKLLAKSYKIIESVNASRALEIADDIKKFTNIKETIRILHRNNYFVSIISSGIPTFVLKKLGQEIYADYCSGLEVTIEQDRIWINPHNNQSKDRIVEKLLGRLGLNWDRVVSVGDDPTNVDLIKKSRLGIGFNPSRVVRKYADVIVEGYDLLELIPYIIPEHRVPRHLTKKQFTIKREIYRKKIHFLGVLVPLGAYLDKHTTVQFLLAVIFLYTLSEFIRYIGFLFNPLASITKRAKRHSENYIFIMSPLLLSVGILLPILSFTPDIFIPSILVICVADSLSALVGLRYGKLHLPFGHRTLEGSGIFFASSLVIMLFFISPWMALLTALVATVIELVSPSNMDNLFVPGGTAVFLHLISSG